MSAVAALLESGQPGRGVMVDHPPGALRNRIPEPTLGFVPGADHLQVLSEQLKAVESPGALAGVPAIEPAGQGLPGPSGRRP